MQHSTKPRLNPRSVIASLQQEFHPSRLIPSLTAALITGVVTIIYALSFVALIFSGDLAPYISTGIGLSLFAAMAQSLIIALMSSSPGMISQIQEAPVAIMGVMAAAIAAQRVASPGEILSTVMVSLALTTLLTGIGCFLLGQFKLGELIRFIPYPVVGGFLAGTGWLLSVGAMLLMTNLSLSLEQLPQLWQPQVIWQWIPGSCFGILLVIVLRRYSHVLLMPGLIIGGIALFYLVLFMTQTSVAEAQAYGLLLGPFPEGSLWQPLQLSTLFQANWQSIFAQAGKMMAILLITVLSLLLNATGIELATGRDLDLNRELRATGMANLLAGLGGGIIGFHGLGTSTLSYAKIGARSRIVGVLNAIGIAAILLAGASVISLFPKPVLGGVALFLGLDFLVEWVYDAWFKLSKTDYFIVILILIVIAAIGFLEGVGVGLAIAIVLFVINYSQVNVAKHRLSGAAYPSHAARSVQQSRLLRTEGDQIYILELQGFLFFGTAHKLLNQIRQRLIHPDLPPLKFLVFSFRAVTGLDSSAVLSFTKLKQIAQRQQLTLVFTHLSPTMQQQLRQGDVLQAEEVLCQNFPDLDRGIEWCEKKILEEIPQRRRRVLPLALQLDNLFSNTDHISGFMGYLEELNLESGQLLFGQGDSADFLYLIELGEVTLSSALQTDQTRRIQSFGAGNLVGEMDFYLRTLHQTSAIVTQPSTLYRLSQDSAQQMRQTHPEVAATFQEFVIETLAERLASSYRQVGELLQ
ncbi:MAG: cyclic nucleotide-binding domain-containing protein [Oscillatoriophycideae cyanobacterium NC_groundwater_1537_Pr4_S-0.65um_50_18]|nr:cyclic nucleotide-binding domain-containing protein [Oscillatoriophycideae cyanobacterium NC_groundwater_1537_Pr4_S-0.65um_50_18]